LRRLGVAGKIRTFMRKQNPNDVVASFQSEIADVVNDWSSMRAAIGTTAGPLAKRATIDAFTRIAVSFEAFRSDWHIAAINRDSSELQKKLATYASSLVKSSTYPMLAPRVRIDLPTHPALEVIRELLDPQGGNLSISSYNHWKKRANSELADPWRSTILTMNTNLCAVLNATIAVRNVLAHQSVRSSATMNDALTRFGAPDAALRRGTREIRPSGLGAYLNASTTAGTTRLERYASRLDDLTSALIV
jgi:hypothetical protein